MHLVFGSVFMLIQFDAYYVNTMFVVHECMIGT